MASVPSQVSWRLGVLLLGLAGLLSAGCVGLNVQTNQDAPNGSDSACELGVRWRPEVAYAPDPANGGQQTPGLVGRVYLFNKKMLPVEGEGSLHVELSDAAVNPPKALEQWNFDAVTLQKYQRKDAVGPGYSVFLPWSTYSKDITNVVLKVAFKPVKGSPLFASPASVLLDGGPKNPMTAR
jgi:hypothetical protein